MKKLTIKDVKDGLEIFGGFVHKQFKRYDQRLKWHDEEIEEIESDIKTINRLITLLFIENIAIILLLIIWSW